MIFRSVRDAGTISRAELARNSGLNPATVTHIVRELLEEGLVEEAGFSESSGGRRSELLRLRAEHRYIVAISLGRRSIAGMLTDLGMRKVIERRLTTPSLAHPPEITLPALLALIQDLIAGSDVSPAQISGIGICAPGPLNARRGLLLTPPNFPTWGNTPLQVIVEGQTGLPTFIDNDANACALAERWFGMARGIDNFVYILAEGGVGSGIVIGGDIFRGQHDVAGEIGHTTIDRHGPRCDCGNHGCLELYASPAGIEQRVSGAVHAGEQTLALDLADGKPERITFEKIVAAAQQGDALARQALLEMSDALGVGIVNVVNSLDPEAVILGGRLALAGDLLLERVREIVASRAMIHALRPLNIQLGALRTDAPMIGAFTLVLRELFQQGGHIRGISRSSLDESQRARTADTAQTGSERNRAPGLMRFPAGLAS
jgi:predicted NBD/HSP70 family sugar kinase